MTSPAPPRLDAETRNLDALEPVRRALLADAGVEAQIIVAEAQSEADELVFRAEQEADDAVERDLRRSRLANDARAAAVLLRARSEARSAVLQRQEELRRELVDRVREAALGLCDDPRYPALLDELERLAGEQLGRDTIVERDPMPGGGVVATAGSLRVDYGLDTLADRALETMPDEVSLLWT